MRTHILPPPVQVTTRGGAGHAAAEHAREKLSQVLALAPAQVLYARAVLTVDPDPARTERAHIEVTADVSGTIVRATGAGDNLREATDRMAPRLRRQLDDLRDRPPGPTRSRVPCRRGGRAGTG
jgi:ribosome-associated translation inhibitor RaiA